MIYRLTETQLQREHKPGAILKLTYSKYRAASIPETTEGYALQPMKVSRDFSVGFNPRNSIIIDETDRIFLLDIFFVKNQFDQVAKIVTFLLGDKTYYCSIPSYTFTIELFEEV